MPREIETEAEAAEFLTSAMYRKSLYWEQSGSSIYAKFEYEGNSFHFEVGLNSGTIHLQQQVDGKWVDIYTVNKRRY